MVNGKPVAANDSCAILDFLMNSARGKENAIAVAELAKKFRVSRQTLHLRIQEMRKLGCPIVGFQKRRSGGIFYAATPLETQKYVEGLLSTIDEKKRGIAKLQTGDIKSAEEVPKEIVGDPRSLKNRKIRALQQIVKHKGRRDAVPINEIARSINCSVQDTRGLLHVLRREGYPLAASKVKPVGVFWMNTKRELTDYITNINSTIRKLESIAGAIARQLPEKKRPQREADVYFDIFDAVKQGKWKKAEDKVWKESRDTLESAKVCVTLAKIFRMRSELEKAHKLCILATQLRKNYADAWAEICRVDEKMARDLEKEKKEEAYIREVLQEGEETIRKAIKIDAQRPEFYCLLTHIFMAQKKEEDAIELLEKMSKELPPYAELFYILGTCYLHIAKEKMKEGSKERKEALKKAEENLKWSLEINPHILEARVSLATVYELQRNQPLEISCRKKNISELDSSAQEFLGNYCYLAKLYNARGNFKKAWETYVDLKTLNEKRIKEIENEVLTNVGVEIKQKGTEIEVSFPYHQKPVEEVKKIPGARWAKFDQGRQVWIVPISCLKEVKQFQEKFGPKKEATCKPGEH